MKRWYFMPSASFYAAVIFLTTVGCWSSNAASGTQVVIGKIDQRIVAEIQGNADNIKVIEITSQGGSIADAISIGKIIFDNDIHVKVKKYCLSACAQYIIPAAKSITISENAIVGFHNSATSMMKVLENSNFLEEAKKYRRLAESEKSYFQKIGLKQDGALFWMSSAELSCILPSNEAQPLALMASKYQFVVLRKDVLERWLGRLINGSVPENERDLISSIKKSIPPKVVTSFVFFNPPVTENITINTCDAGTE